jgi:hypothetical protein
MQTPSEKNLVLVFLETTRFPTITPDFFFLPHPSLLSLLLWSWSIMQNLLKCWCFNQNGEVSIELEVQVKHSQPPMFQLILQGCEYLLCEPGIMDEYEVVFCSFQSQSIYSLFEITVILLM